MKSNKNLLTFLLILTCADMNESWAMQRINDREITLPYYSEEITIEHVKQVLESLKSAIYGDSFWVSTPNQKPLAYFIRHESRIVLKRLGHFETEEYFPINPTQGDVIAFFRSILPYQPEKQATLEARLINARDTWFADSRATENAKLGLTILHSNVLKNITFASQYADVADRLNNRYKNDNRNEFLTAVTRLLAIEFNMYCKGKDANSSKILLTRIIADICRISNDYYALCNQANKQNQLPLLDRCTTLSLLFDFLNILTKTSKLLGKQNSKNKGELIEAKKDVTVSKILKLVNAFANIAPHLEGIAAIIRSNTKFGNLENATAAQCCTLFIVATRMAEYYVESADSKIEIFKAVPYLMLACTVFALIGDFII